MTRIVLAEDSTLLRVGLVEVLERFGHQVLAAVGDADALIEAVAEHEPDIVIVDVRMPPGYSDEGLRAALKLRADRPTLPILVLSQYVEQTYASELLNAGRGSGAGTGYLLKDRIADVADFADAVVSVASGGTVIDPEVVEQMLSLRRPLLKRLTAREREVLALMAEGRSNSAISRLFSVTDAAVKKHIASILSKLELPPDNNDDHRRVLAVLAYLREGG